MKQNVAKLINVVVLAVAIALPSLSYAQAVEEEPTALAMTGDLIARPVLFAITVFGTAAYVVSLPFTLVGGNSAEAAETLVIGPAEATFVRCLGCTKSGRKEKVKVVSAEP